MPSHGGLGTKNHQLVDGAGMSLASPITPQPGKELAHHGSPAEQPRAHRPVGRPRTRPNMVLGDKAYSCRTIRSDLRARGITAVTPSHRTSRVTADAAIKAASGLLPSTGPCTKAVYKGRNVLEPQSARLKQ